MMKKLTILLGAFLICATSMVAVGAAKKEDKPAKEKKAKQEVTIHDILAEWVNPTPSGDVDVDCFFEGVNGMMLSYKAMNDEINFVKIVTNEIPDAGDGVTTEVIVTDVDGNAQTKEATAERWGEISINLAATAVSAAEAVISGTNIVKGISSNPSKAMAMGSSVKQMKTCIKALELLGQEIPRTVELIDGQVKAMKQVKAN